MTRRPRFFLSLLQGRLGASHLDELCNGQPLAGSTAGVLLQRSPGHSSSVSRSSSRSPDNSPERFSSSSTDWLSSSEAASVSGCGSWQEQLAAWLPAEDDSLAYTTNSVRRTDSGQSIHYVSYHEMGAGHLIREDSFLYASDASKNRQALADTNALAASAKAAAAGPPWLAPGGLPLPTSPTQSEQQSAAATVGYTLSFLQWCRQRHKHEGSAKGAAPSIASPRNRRRGGLARAGGAPSAPGSAQGRTAAGPPDLTGSAPPPPSLGTTSTAEGPPDLSGSTGGGSSPRAPWPAADATAVRSPVTGLANLPDRPLMLILGAVGDLSSLCRCRCLCRRLRRLAHSAPAVTLSSGGGRLVRSIWRPVGLAWVGGSQAGLRNIFATATAHGVHRLELARVIDLVSFQRHAEAMHSAGFAAKLRHLDLSLCPGLKSLEGLEHCGGLAELKLRGCLQLQSLKPLATCAQSGALTTLDLTGCAGLRSLSPIGTGEVTAPGLTALNLTCCERLPADELVSAAAGGCCPALAQFWLSGNAAIDQLALSTKLATKLAAAAAAAEAASVLGSAAGHGCLAQLYLNGLSALKSLDGLLGWAALVAGDPSNSRRAP
eukprot:SAG22_NODE_1655_length_3892_cov_2.729765_1_plen_603_part_00